MHHFHDDHQKMMTRNRSVVPAYPNWTELLTVHLRQQEREKRERERNVYLNAHIIIMYVCSQSCSYV